MNNNNNTGLNSHQSISSLPQYHQNINNSQLDNGHIVTPINTSLLSHLLHYITLRHHHCHFINISHRCRWFSIIDIINTPLRFINNGYHYTLPYFTYTHINITNRLIAIIVPLHYHWYFHWILLYVIFIDWFSRHWQPSYWHIIYQYAIGFIINIYSRLLLHWYCYWCHCRCHYYYISMAPLRAFIITPPLHYLCCFHYYYFFDIIATPLWCALLPTYFA